MSTLLLEKRSPTKKSMNNMKCTLREVVTAYNRMDKASPSTLGETDVIKWLKARNAMRPHYNGYKAFLEDCQATYKPENWDKIEAKLRQWQNEGEKTSLTEQEREEVNKTLYTYNLAIEKAMKDELAKEIELDFEKLGENADAKLIIENGWKSCELDDIKIIL